jgi:NTE family protein
MNRGDSLSGMARGLGLALALAATGCASMIATDARPLPAGKLAPPGSDSISLGGYRLDTLRANAEAPDLIVAIAMSGGGKRSASFGYGALKGMRDVMVRTPAGPRTLLSQIDYMSGVSGGSFPIAYYGLYRDEAFGRFETDFLYSDTNAYIFGTYLLPWNWAWLVQPGIGTNDFMDRAYDRTMFHGATYADLQARGRPLIAVGATDISYGTPWVFTQETFDLICSDLAALPISRAVAASNGFPGLFSPVTLTNHAKDCGGRKPAWLRGITEADMNDPLSRKGMEARRAERYLNADQTVYVHLSDGGVSDNLAMRTAGNNLLTLTAAGVKQRGFLGVRRVLMISIDGQSAQDSAVAQQKEVGGIMKMIGLVSGAQIDSYNFETFTTVTGQLKDFTSRLVEERCKQSPMVDGSKCGDVQSALLHISLTGLPDSPEKNRLLSIPTGLTLKKTDVDALVRAGHDAVVNSTALKTFLANYPNGGASAVVRPAT